MAAAQTIALALPAIVEALGLAANLLQSVQDDDTDDQALAKLDAQMQRTDAALDGLRAAITARRDHLSGVG